MPVCEFLNNVGGSKIREHSEYMRKQCGFMREQGGYIYEKTG